MKKEELLKLSKEELIDRIHAKHMNYNNILWKYRELKASLLLVKKQLSKIADNIEFTNGFDKGNSLVVYHSGGNIRNKIPNKCQKSRIDRRRRLKNESQNLIYHLPPS